MLKLTKQGVRDLNTKQRDGRHRECAHVWLGQAVVGWRNDTPYDLEASPVYGQQCIVCKAVRR